MFTGDDLGSAVLAQANLQAAQFALLLAIAAPSTERLTDLGYANLSRSTMFNVVHSGTGAHDAELDDARPAGATRGPAHAATPAASGRHLTGVISRRRRTTSRVRWNQFRFPNLDAR
jgi:uncharacterized protein YjbI with pentapeptide repeats